MCIRDSINAEYMGSETFNFRCNKLSLPFKTIKLRQQLMRKEQIMRNLILISIVAVILSSCAGVQNTAYTDDLYYIPQDKNQQLPATADEQTTIVENKEALNYLSLIHI
eukprot:TRINITY_DN23940_c0_g2_i1.p1 TRINITY_DN23940_c0_g2~~TRINITY_DN23940_c0_g2_i1.p1  ORF type:complete len:127 (-),score=7.75 TRINITY_DN23940_c0_g2_i1:53-379(-)